MQLCDWGREFCRGWLCLRQKGTAASRRSFQPEKERNVESNDKATLSFLFSFCAYIFGSDLPVHPVTFNCSHRRLTKDLSLAIFSPHWIKILLHKWITPYTCVCRFCSENCRKTRRSLTTLWSSTAPWELFSLLNSLYWRLKSIWRSPTSFLALRLSLEVILRCCCSSDLDVFLFYQLLPPFLWMIHLCGSDVL